MRAAVVLTILLATAMAMTAGCLGGGTPEPEVIVVTATPEPSATPDIQATVDASIAVALTKAAEQAATPPPTETPIPIPSPTEPLLVIITPTPTPWPTPTQLPTATPQPTATRWSTPTREPTEGADTLWSNSGAWYRNPSMEQFAESLIAEQGDKAQARTVLADYERREDLDPMRIELTCVEHDIGYKEFLASIVLIFDRIPATADYFFLSIYDYQTSEFLDGFDHIIEPLIRNDDESSVVIASLRDLIPLRRNLEKASEDATRYSVSLSLYDVEDNQMYYSEFATSGFGDAMRYLNCD